MEFHLTNLTVKVLLKGKGELPQKLILEACFIVSNFYVVIFWQAIDANIGFINLHLCSFTVSCHKTLCAYL